MKLLKKKYFLSFLLSFIAISMSATGMKHGEAQNTVKFTENKSQWEKNVLYRAQLDGGALFLEENSFTYHFYDKEALRKSHVNAHNSDVTNDRIRTKAFRMTFLNALKSPEATGKNLTPDYCNYFIGKDRKKWVGHVNNYKEVYYRNLYSGIDLQVLGMQNSLKYNFIVAPHASADDIQLQYEGLKSIKLIKGALHIDNGLNEMVEEKPVAYQVINNVRIEVPCRFVLKNNTVHFGFPRGYNKNAELIIDPILVFACTSGSIADNFGMTATYDDAGNLYAGGTVYGVGYPTVNAFDSTWNGLAYNQLRTDVVITKFDSSGTFLQYSTYLGGLTSTEVVSSLIVNNQDELMLFGATGSSDFPVTATAFDTSFNGGTNVAFFQNGTGYDNGTDLYLTRFSADGSSLLASTFVGGSENEGTNNSTTLVFNYGDYYRGEIQADAAGNFYIASCTVSPDFPVTAGCAQPVIGGGMDGIVFKMSSDLTTMVWSTFLGGGADDGCYALTLDNASNIYTTGGTSSPNFPVTAGAYSTVYNGGITDGFISKIQNTGAAVLNSTFVGTTLYDQGFLIQLDNSFDVYIVGQSLGTMPVSAGAYFNPNSKQFIWKMNGALSNVLITTIFGNGNGQVNISPSAFLVDICGNIYVSGWGGNILTGLQTNAMPITSDAYQSTTDGFNFYLFVLAPDATSLLYGTYFGGALSQEHVDGGTSRFDKKGIVYQAVCANCGGNTAATQHDDFPVTPGSWPGTPGDPNHNTQNFNCNMGVFKFDFQTAGVSADAAIVPNDTICAGDSVSFNNASSNAFNYLWNFGDGSPISTVASPSHAYPLPGTYNVTLIAVDSTGCIFSDTSDLTVVVAPIPVVDIGNDTILCQSPNLVLNAGTSGNIYLWSGGDTTQTITAASSGTYWVKISNGNCEASDTMNIQEIILDPFLGNDTSLCDGQSLTLNAFEPGLTYLWSTGDTSSSITVSIAGQYWVQVTSGPCTESDTIIVSYIPYPVISLPASVIICPDDSVVLDAGGPATSYLWSTSDTTQMITVSSSGTYLVTASNFQCSAIDSVIAQQILFPVLENDTSLCAGQTIDLNVFYPGATYFWSTTATTAGITVSLPGQYWVAVSFGGCAESDTININYLSYPVVNLIPNITICQGDSVLLDAGSPATAYLWSTGDTSQTIYASSTGLYIATAFNQQCSASDTTNIYEIGFLPMIGDTTLCAGQTISLSAATPGATYLWSSGANTASVIVSSPGQYWVTTTVGFCENKDTVNIAYVPYPVVNLPTAVEICPLVSVLLDAGNTASAYLWSTGAQTQSISVSTGGTYIVTASNLHCSVTDTTIVNAIPPVSWSSTTTLCNVEKYTLESGITANTYLWSTGETTPSIDIVEAGTYWVVANTNNCVISDTITIDGGLGNGVIWFPNSFTPNSNGLNDKFSGKGADITYFHMMIFNRWGELIFETEKQDEGWDGFYKGHLAQQDVYVWKVKYKTKCSKDQLNSKIGHVTLVR
jgi:gliding motility-associated-like protein